MSKRFLYSYKPFGTPFSSECPLEYGELATDVGGRCLAYDGEQSLAIDHHFHRPNNFPSASAAVLHLAPIILDRLKTCEQVKLITHQNPDFDAFCSLYLVRRILEGAIPVDGWKEYGVHPDSWDKVILPGKDAKPSERKIDWFAHNLKFFPPERRMPVLLAVYASMVDQCKSLHCDRRTALHSILYAGAARGRDWESDGGYSFFRAVEERIQQGLNPLFDSLFDDRTEYAPELALLRREEELYRRDIARARITVVNIPFDKGSFHDWFSPLSSQALLSDPKKVEINPLHLCKTHPRRQVDGLFLRDPESILFKEWARMDYANSPGGRGFIFTAIANSASIATAEGNKSRYFFSLNPELSDGAHLYPVWARLQAAECLLSTATPNTAREKFEGRLSGVLGANDPWFDGHNYGVTIIDTPKAGTQLKSGVLADLSDDEAAQIVRQELEWNIFVPEDSIQNPLPGNILVSAVRIQDFSTSDHAANATAGYINLRIDELAPLPNANDALRFASVGLPSDVETSSPIVAESIGKTLWAAIADEGVKTFPTDFHSRHLWFDSSSVTVWNRHGIAIASKETKTIQYQKKMLEQIAAILRTAQLIAESSDPEYAFQKGRQLLASVIHLQTLANNPRNATLRHLMKALEIHFIVESVTAINRERFEASEQTAQESRDMRLQAILAVGTAIGLMISWNQMESVSLRALHAWFSEIFPSIGCIAPDAGILVLLKFIFGLLLAVLFAWLFLKSTGKSKIQKK